MPWLLQQKISVPKRAAGYFHRGWLVELALPTQRCVTVLLASGGFGKTTLLAECCRRLARDGVATAWVSLGEQDEPGVLDSCIAFACQSAGLEIAGGFEPDEAGRGPETRVGFVLRAIEALGRPFVLAFDELDRLGNPASVVLLDFLRQRAPDNLHLAFACHHLPVGLNIAADVLEGRAAVLTTDQLRFSRTEVAEFFDSHLSGSALDTLVADSAGWPFALRIARNGMQVGIESNPRAVRNLVENWVESRLFEGIGRDDRDCLLDIGLFDWIDAALLDEVLERNDSQRQLDTMPVLVGLLEPVGGGAAESWLLQPLVRQHCARQRFRETPQRCRSIHRRLAEALVRRGETVAGMRHAVEAGELGLAGRILEDAGGVRLWIREGAIQLQAYQAASGAIVDLRLVKDGVEAALGAADEMLEYVRAAALPALVRHLSALRVSVLASAGRVAAAERAWRLEGLPEALEGCLDLNGQTWREMEALSCARLGLLIAGGRFEVARSFAAELGLTGHGVRYHLRKLFAKLGANNRGDALRRARELDLIPDES